MRNRLFYLGAVFYIISFALPIGNGVFGISLALVVFDLSSDEPMLEAVMYVILLSITNIASLSILICYFMYFSKIISMLGILGSITAVYWVVTIFIDNYISFLPYAIVSWACGSLMLTLAYELKRRRS